MPTIKLADGTTHEVTGTWYVANVAPFPGIDRIPEANREIMRQNLLNTSNNRPLDVAETKLLGALTCWKNVCKSWVLMAGRHYSEVGFRCLDQVHHNREHHPCGCILNHIHDHNEVLAGKKTVVSHPHHMTKTCDAHAQHAGDFSAHYNAVVADSAANAKKE